MDSDFYHQIINSNAHRWQRDLNCETALQSNENLATLFNLTFTLANKNHFKACWALELVLEQKLELIEPYLAIFSKTVSDYKNDSAIRSISKICLFLSNAKTIQLSQKQEQQLIATCFDWLIQDEKVATKAYAMRSLYNFSKKHHWIATELQTILSQDYPNHSVAYKSAAKDILKKLNKR